jgi:excisionase family DNA binding protein
MERFLTLSEVRAMLKISRASLWRWQAEHGLKVVRVGGVTRIRERDLQEFLARHSVESSETLSDRAQNGAASLG